ncbi:MAG: hypothetical protein ACETVZ_05390, partial [Phycisphaerae bacterium]
RMVYIAQPPLYEIRVKGQKKSEYILSEGQMRKRMIGRGLEGTELLIRDGDPSRHSSRLGTHGQTLGPKTREKRPKVGRTRKVSDKKLTALVKLLADAERIIGVLSRRGINFDEFVKAYYDPRKGGLPRFLIRVQGQQEIYYDNTKYEKRLDELKELHRTPNGESKSADETEQDIRPSSVEGLFEAEELHEVARINQINEKLKAEFDLSLNDFIAETAETADFVATKTQRHKEYMNKKNSCLGAFVAKKFQLVSGKDTYDIASLGDICPAIRQIGGKGIDIKRFKGLGEMNAEQLWQTTMNPTTRTLLSVRLDDAGEADRLFSILMGDDVEKRRAFIQQHALEVQNLDI